MAARAGATRRLNGVVWENVTCFTNLPDSVLYLSTMELEPTVPLLPASDGETVVTLDAAAADEVETGWDPNRVWRDRVQSPRLARELTEPDPLPAATTARPVDGWDPIETWRFRVLRPLNGAA